MLPMPAYAVSRCPLVRRRLPHECAVHRLATTSPNATGRAPKAWRSRAPAGPAAGRRPRRLRVASSIADLTSSRISSCPAGSRYRHIYDGQARTGRRAIPRNPRPTATEEAPRNSSRRFSPVSGSDWCPVPKWTTRGSLNAAATCVPFGQSSIVKWCSPGRSSTDPRQAPDTVRQPLNFPGPPGRPPRTGTYSYGGRSLPSASRVGSYSRSSMTSLYVGWHPGSSTTNRSGTLASYVAPWCGDRAFTCAPSSPPHPSLTSAALAATAHEATITTTPQHALNTRRITPPFVAVTAA